MALCSRFLELIGWPRTRLLVYGPAGVGKTTLALELAKLACESGLCLYITTTSSHLIEKRANQLGVRLENLRIVEAFDYLDFIRIVEVRNLPLYSLVCVDAVNEFMREPSDAIIKATTFLEALLYVLSEEFATSIVLTGVVSGKEGEERVTALKLVEPWVDYMVRLERRGQRLRAIVEGVQLSKSFSFEYVIEEGGMRWLTC